MADRCWSLLRAALVLASLGASGAAIGADEKPAKKPTAAKPAASKPAVKSPVLTPEQLQACLNDRDRLRSQTDEALKDKAVIESDKAEIARSASELAEQLPTLNRESAEAIGAFNAKVVARDQLIAGYQARIAAYNTKAEAVKASQEAYEKACEQRRYDERDLNELKQKK